MKKIIFRVITGLIFLALLLMVAGSYLLTYATYGQELRGDRLTEAIEKGHYTYEETKTLKSGELSVRSANNKYDIKVDKYGTSNNKGKSIIMVHGVKSNKWDSLVYAKPLIDKGYTVYVYSSRMYDAKSSNYPQSYGVFESKDLKNVVSKVKSQDNNKLGVYGVSMGAATTLQYAVNYNEDKEVSFFISDSGFSNIFETFLYQGQAQFGLPKFVTTAILWVTQPLCKLLYGWDYEQSNVKDKIEKVKEPILFLQGDKDETVPFESINQLFKHKKQGYKEMHVYAGEKHVMEREDNPAVYYKDVNNYLEHHTN